MTVEQVLVYLLAATAGIFLFLGLAQAFGDGRIRPRRRRGVTRETGDDGPPGMEGSEAPGLAPAWARPRKAVDLPDPALPDGLPSEPAGVTVAGAPIPPVSDPGPAALTMSAAEGNPVTPPLPAAFAADPELVIVEDAMRLCLGGQHEALLGRLEPRLADSRDDGSDEPRAHVTTALRSLAGLAHHALGDAPGAHGNLEAGGRALPNLGAAPCPPGVAELSIPIARRLLDLAGASSPSDGARGDSGPVEGGRAGGSVAAARLAAFWLSWRLRAAPGDEQTLALLDTAREAVAESHALAATAAIGRHEYDAARAMVQRAVVAGELPGVRGEMLLELLGVTFRREIDHLTAGAIRGGPDESGAVGGLGRAEALLGTMPEGVIGPAYRAAVAQRIWRAHSKLGFRRLGAGQLDAAADSLFHALAMREIGRRRQRQVRDALVRTLEALGDQRAAAISALLAEGKQPAAAEEVVRLELRIRRAREEGVSDQEVEVAAAKVEQLRRRLDESAAAG